MSSVLIPGVSSVLSTSFGVGFLQNTHLQQPYVNLDCIPGEFSSLITVCTIFCLLYRMRFARFAAYFNLRLLFSSRTLTRSTARQIIQRRVAVVNLNAFRPTIGQRPAVSRAVRR